MAPLTMLNALVMFAGPQDVPYVYCLFYVIFVPLRWIYYRYKKWHYYLLVSALPSRIFASQGYKMHIQTNLFSSSPEVCLYVAWLLLLF
jgi:hypothetical protein